MQPLIGVDFGGTKIECAALDEGGQCIARLRTPTPDNYGQAISATSALIAEVEQQVGHVDKVGIGAPGSISPRSGLIRNANRVYLNGQNFARDLEHKLGKSVRLSNDANCFAISEAVDGAAADGKIVFGVILGTGCGGGLVVNGQLIEGANGIGGEWGHNPLPWIDGREQEGEKCWCGQAGCLETWISGSGLERDFQRTAARELGAKEIVHAARNGDAQAAASFHAYLDRLARALAAVANLLDPDVFVLGGGMANVEEIYETVPQLMEKFIFCDHWAARICRAKWGDSSGVRGAARLFGG